MTASASRRSIRSTRAASRTSSSPMRCALGGTSGNENLEATPLVEDGFMYMVDLWGIVYKIDVRSGDAGRIVWRMNPKQEKVANANRGVALWGNLVISQRQLSAAHHRDRQGHRQDRLGDRTCRPTGRGGDHRGAARRQGQDHRRRLRRRPRRARLHRRRSMPRPASGSGSNTPSRRPASPAARPGRTRTMPGRPAAAPSG